MNAHAHSCQVEVIIFESYSFVLMFFDVAQDGLPVLVDLIFCSIVFILAWGQLSF